MKILITSALPYANGPLHFGHIAGAYLPGDCYARFQRLQKNNVLYICGSDEYGVAITMSADIAGRTPKEHVDIFHAKIKELFGQLNFSFDHYSRTTWEGHKEVVQQFFLQLLENGYIEEKITDQLYSHADGKFLADRYVVGTCPKCKFPSARGDECPECGASYDATDLLEPRSKLTGAALTLQPTQHWFLKLELFKDRLLSWLEDKQWKPNVINFIKGYIQDLHARSITRDSTWGVPIPLPNTDGKVLYVWFDAPIGYISATMEWAQLKGEPEEWKKYWLDEETKLVQFIGKDNIPFHAAIFPAMIMGQNVPYKLVDELPANEFFKFEGKQFSKSEGWYIDLEDFFKRFKADQIRYAIAANAPESADTEFTWNDFLMRCNTELLGKYGNFANRTLVFAKTHCQGTVPQRGALEPIDEAFLAHIDRLVAASAESYGQFKLRQASQQIMELAHAGNVYFDSKHPWKDVKSEATKARMETTIACCLHCLKALALISYPIMPETAAKMWQMLGCEFVLSEISWSEIANCTLAPGATLLEPMLLFEKIEPSDIALEKEKLQKQYASVQNAMPPQLSPIKPSIDFSAWQQQDLRVGVILGAEPIEKSKKLLKLHVDIGTDKRTIVSGIRAYYSAAELIGKKVVIVANLPPATLMGIESQGMVLTASVNGKLELLSVQDLPAGAIIS
jgi:methionyl-tRNA synthetase